MEVASMLLLTMVPWCRYEYYEWRMHGTVFGSILLSTLLFLLLNILRRIEKIELGDGLQGAIVRLDCFARDTAAQLVGRDIISTLMTRKLGTPPLPIFLANNGSGVLLSTAAHHVSSCPKIVLRSFDLLLQILQRDAPPELLTKRHCAAISDLLEQTQTHVEVQRLGCMLLGCAAATTPEMQTFVVQTDGVQAVCRAMQTHLTAAKIQQWGCWALFNISNENVLAKSTIITAKGPSRLLQAMEGHPEHKETQILGCLALNSCLMGISDSLRASTAGLATADGLRPIVQNAMKEFPDETQIQSLGQLLLAFSRVAPPVVEELE